jgi:hypothetical protein
VFSRCFTAQEKTSLEKDAPEVCVISEKGSCISVFRFRQEISISIRGGDATAYSSSS